jgi:hypothetical protein
MSAARSICFGGRRLMNRSCAVLSVCVVCGCVKRRVYESLGDDGIG